MGDVYLVEWRDLGYPGEDRQNIAVFETRAAAEQHIKTNVAIYLAELDFADADVRDLCRDQIMSEYNIQAVPLVRNGAFNLKYNC